MAADYSRYVNGANEREFNTIYLSDVSTGRLTALALTAETVEGRSELFGRSHAFYSAGHTREAAAAFLQTVTLESEQRRIACTALAMAGIDLASIRSGITATLGGGTLFLVTMTNGSARRTLEIQSSTPGGAWMYATRLGNAQNQGFYPVDIQEASDAS